MNNGMKALRLCCALVAMVVTGCAEGFLNASKFLDTVSGGLNSLGSCLSPLEPIDLNEVFGKAPAVAWVDGAAEVTDAVQPDVQAFLSEQLGQDILPINYRILRFEQVGPLNNGETIQIEALSDVADHVALYDADYTLIPAGSMHDFDGRRRTLRIPITRDMPAAYLRVDLEYLSETNQPILRLTRAEGIARPEPRGQTVVLHFGGQADVTFRSGYLVPAQVGAIDDPAVRQAATEQFRAIYAPYNVTVLTDSDPQPAEPFGVVYIGPADLSTYNYGISEIIDSRNAYQDDIAVVDTNQPALEVAGLLGPETYGRAIGTIAAHEMGHLLGLEHVADPDALMTGVQCQGTGVDIERMLHRQIKRAPILLAAADLKQWVVGYQDAAADLLDALGSATPQGQ